MFALLLVVYVWGLYFNCVVMSCLILGCRFGAFGLFAVGLFVCVDARCFVETGNFTFAGSRYLFRMFRRVVWCLLCYRLGCLYYVKGGMFV